MMVIPRWLGVTLFVLAIPCMYYADVLLLQNEAGTGPNGFDGYPIGSLANGASICLFYQTPDQAIFSQWSYPIGNSLLLPNGFTGSFNINSATDPNFAGFAAHATDLTNESNLCYGAGVGTNVNGYAYNFGSESSWGFFNSGLQD